MATTSPPSRRLYAVALLPLAAALAVGARWWWQGSDNLYTAPQKRFYIPDIDLGWRAETTTRLWLGLDALAIMLACAVGLAVAAYLVLRREQSRPRWRSVRVALVAAGLGSWLVPAAAWLSGGRPPGARDALPARVSLAALPEGFDGGLPLPAGTYAVVPQRSSLAAKLKAGGEAFDAAFATGVDGTLRVDFADLSQPINGSFSVPAAVVDTGIGKRSQHAREEYLRAAEYPTITFTLERFSAARLDSPTSLQVRAHGKFTLRGQDSAVAFTGTVRMLDAGARERLGITAHHAVMVEGMFPIDVMSSALAPHRDSFDSAQIPLHVTLTLQLAGENTAAAR